MTGIEALRELRTRHPEAVVVVCSSVSAQATILEAISLGARDYVIKPINADAMRSVIERLVERKRHLTQIESAQAKLVANERLAAIGQMVAGLAHESRNAFQRSHACLAELSLDLTEMPESLALESTVAPWPSIVLL